jgi:transposase
VIEAQVPADLEIHLIVDNYGTHKTSLIRKWFAKRPRFYVHFTPTYGSWINLVERWFAELTNKRIRRGVFRSVKELEAAIASTSARTTRIRHPSSGLERRIKSWTASLATPGAPWLSNPPDLCHEPLGQETRLRLGRFNIPIACINAAG